MLRQDIFAGVFPSGAGLAVANIPHSDCTVFTPVTARQPSLIALGERFKALESVYRLCVVFGNRQNKVVLAVLLMTSSYLASCPIGPSASRCCPYRGLQRRWNGHARSGQLLGAGFKQSILLNVAAPRAFVRQMESTSHDPFATLAARGCGCIGRTRYNLAGNAPHSRAVAAARSLFPDLAFG